MARFPRLYRRTTTSLLIAWLFLAVRVAVAPARPAYPHKTLGDAYRAAGFDPTAKGCFVFAATADTHYGIVNEAGVLPIVEEVNAMRPPPCFFTIVGDMIHDASKFFGQVPDKKQRLKAIAEYRQLKAHLARLDGRIPFQPVLGNHDTYPGETDCGLFRAVFSEHEPYASFDVAGVHFIRLNGGPGGKIAGRQLSWLLKDTAKLPRDRTVVVLVHQPALGSRVRERGVAQAISRAFARHEGPIWAICGHHHTNKVRTFKLPETQIAQFTITRGAEPGWGFECPGYWVFCMRNGKLAARIFRRLGKGYRIDPAPDFDRAKSIPLPFDGRDDLIKTILVGEGDEKFRVKADAANSVLDWVYVKEIVYRLPLAGLPKKPSRLAILASVSALKAKKHFRVSVSADGKGWQPLDLPGHRKDIYTFEIPAGLRGGKHLYVRILSEGFQSSLSVGGFALCE